MTYRSQFDATGMSDPALAAWAEFERLTGRGWNVNSAYRSPEHNERVGGAKHSQHTHGNAFDIDVAGMSEAERLGLINKAREAGFQGVGIYDNALHFDVGPQRAWGPDYTRNSIPEWARETANVFSGTPIGPRPELAFPAPSQRPAEAPEEFRHPFDRKNALGFEWSGYLNPADFMVMR